MSRVAADWARVLHCIMRKAQPAPLPEGKVPVLGRKETRQGIVKGQIRARRQHQHDIVTLFDQRLGQIHLRGRPALEDSGLTLRSIDELLQGLGNDHVATGPG